MWTYLRQLPQPFKTLYLAAFAVFLVGFVVVAVARVPGDVRFVLAPFALLVAAQGAVLALDLRHNAMQVSQVMKTTKPLGVDYSGSVMSSVTAIRALGAAVLVVGILMAVASALGSWS